MFSRSASHSLLKVSQKCRHDTKKRIVGFYFLETDGSYPLMHDPRQGAVMTHLPEIDDSQLTPLPLISVEFE